MSGMFKRSLIVIFVAFVIAAVSGVTTTWPLLRHANAGIPALHRADHGSLLVSIPGDHLQLMYFFQLMRDFVTGETPFFHNLYEFNDGDDSARYEFDFYYMPFSLIFTLVELATGNPALAWNITGFMSLWLGVLGILLLVQRFSSDRWVILAATLAGTVLPYRLATFLHGSPTGFVIAYVPFMLLGLDYAIRDKKMGGGFLAGAVFFFAEWIDLHTYFFLALVAPFWCAFVYLYEDVSFSWQRIRKTAIALFPLVIFVCAAAARVFFIRQGLQESVMAAGRTLTEVAQFSPTPDAYWSLNPDHPSSYAHITFIIPLMVLIGMVHAACTLRHETSSRSKWRFLLALGLLAGVCVILLLGLGPRMPLPRADRLWELLVRFVRPYRMIRQPAKIQALLPSLFAVLIVLPFAGKTAGGLMSRRCWVYGILAALLLCEVAWRMDPAISLLDKEQGAYSAVVLNAERQGEVPRALGIVLWPGNSHWTSLKQYYGMKYRIRMLNGYRPRVPATYFNDVFLRFESMNRGYASAAQLDALLGMGIRHIVLHEDAFPEQVSPFGVAQTIKGLLENPRIRFMAQDRAVWAFEIMEHAADDYRVSVPWNTASVTYCWEAERLAAGDSAAVAAPDARGGLFVRLSQPDNLIQIPARGIHYSDSLRLSARVRGHGVLRRRMVIDDAVDEITLPVAADDWVWLDIPYPAFDGFHSDLRVTLAAIDGELDVDYVYVAKGNVPGQMQAGDVFRMPAPTLFRAGYTNLESNDVALRPDLVPEAHVLYGPRLPLPAGHYNIRLIYEVGTGGTVGEFGVRYPKDPDNPGVVAVMGNAGVAEITHHQQNNLPLTVEFLYNRTAPITIRALEIERVE